MSAETLPSARARRIHELERRIADLRARLPKHTPSPAMLYELDELEDELRRLKEENDLADFRLILLKHCGHKPWIERQAREEFYRILKEELWRKSTSK